MSASEWNLPSPPRFDFSGAPASDRSSVEAVELALLGMSVYVRRFNSALMLLDRSDREIQEAFARRKGGPTTPEYLATYSEAKEYSAMAARDGIMSVYHFRDAMQSAGNFNGSLYLTNLLDKKPMRQTQNYFDSLFPAIKTLRNEVAHEGEVTAAKIASSFISTPINTPEISAPAGSVSIQGSMFERSYAFSVKGQMVSLDLVEATRDKLERVMLRYFSHFPQHRPPGQPPKPL